jgi:hypothetical protein
MANSKIDITFLEAFEPNTATNAFIIPYNNFSTQTGGIIEEKIVVTRSNPNEFSEGTDATDQADKFEDALILDYGSGWTITRAGAVVTITATDPNIEFSEPFIGLPNDSRISFVITNNSNNIQVTDGIMLARSNYYLSLAYGSETFQDVKMWFKSGDLTQPLGTPSYTKRVFKPSINSEFLDTQISNFALDYITPKPVYATTGAIDSAEGSVIATYVNTQSSVQIGQQERIKKLITTRGYSDYLDNANFILDDDSVLLSSKINQVQRDGVIMIPMVNKGQTLTLENDAGQGFSDVDFSGVTDNAKELIQYAFFNVEFIDGDYFRLEGTEYIWQVVDECKYTPQEVFFLNAYGVFEKFTFYKAQQENINFTSEGEYKNNFVRGGQYDTTRHLYRSSSRNGRKTITLNTGYIDQDQNNAIEQMLNSEYIYFREGTDFIPVNIDTNSLQVLTRLNDKLISYQVNFKQSFDLVQNV